MFKILLGIFIGGGFGSLARFAVSRWITDNFQKINPTGTLVANLISTAILAFFILFMLRRNVPEAVKLMVTVGFCGGFSTFSTFSYETYMLLKAGHYWFAAGNVIISVSLALFIIHLMIKSF